MLGELSRSQGIETTGAGQALVAVAGSEAPHSGMQLVTPLAGAVLGFLALVCVGAAAVLRTRVRRAVDARGWSHSRGRDVFIGLVVVAVVAGLLSGTILLSTLSSRGT